MPFNRKLLRLKNALLIALVISFNLGDADCATATEGCDHLAATVSQEYDVPLSVLRAIPRTETGRKGNGSLEPWPWATRALGQGFWSESKTSAVNNTQRQNNGEVTNVDIGCFQLSYRWPVHAFTSISEMFDPAKNARYAAQFLTQLYAEKGRLIQAVGAYRSLTQERAARCKGKSSEAHANFASSDTSASPKAPANENQFPLLKSSNAQPGLKLLVPQGDPTSRRVLVQCKGEI
ncbi:transglycosylase SLT domain-containing protein [Roseobacter sp. MH60115]|uniref:transglycosylase SLT domain-containing protein n=1 Tax=Roseobacter sp. MH60115 TaxID=2785324 RepID=UPI0018A2B572|nr:transglycosylase SLT domain-containing protein [Roseobacter sp. MH60115]